MKRVLFVIVFGLAGTAVLLALGKWQLDRLSWKQAILHEIDSKISAQPVNIPQQPTILNARYLPVEAKGQLLPNTIRVLVSQKRIGAGYRLISAFETDGRRVLLDRGFIKVDALLPSSISKNVSVLGNLHWPDEIDGYTPPPDRKKNIWFARDVEAMAKELGTLPILIVASKVSPPEKAVSPLPIDSSGIPNDHLQYAITWFSLAAVWITMSAVFLRRTRTRKKA
ncbi:MAG: SURF1 family protein [Marinovum sp.]|nr:SURF1 family protein [Marinovum sp.]MBT6097811.1 SURF1 family protein [Marinovum sp.]MBT7908356.1 SURF1 family protein [Marinovum sp.]